MLTLNQFVAAVAAELSETDPKTIGPKTVFRDLEEWSSLFAIDVFAILSQNNNINVNIYDLTDCETIEDIYYTIQKLQSTPVKPKEDVLTQIFWKE